MNAYLVLKDKHQKEVNEFPFFFAFSEEQFNKGMEKFGLKPDETDKICSLGIASGFLLKTDAERCEQMFARHEKEMKDAIAADSTGEGFIFEMFNCELANHEYVVGRDVDSTLDALGLKPEDIAKDPRLQHGLKLAKKRQIEQLEAE